jgi:hypothetical protein
MDIKNQYKRIPHSNPARSHWDSVYERKSPGEVSWFQPSPVISLELIRAVGVGYLDAIIDVGGGASTLVDHLLERGFGNITVLDISKAAIDTNHTRLGSQARRVTWVVGDVLEFQPDRSFELWHDRACFHFMTSETQRKKYVRSLELSVVAGGACIIAAFAPDGPRRCSGRDIVRYDADRLLEELGPKWQLERQVHENHRTPAGSTQSFNYFLLRRA